MLIKPTLLFAALFSLAAASAQVKFATVSDVHVMAPSLVEQDGKALNNYLLNDRKLLRESVDLLDTTLNRLLVERPEFVLVSGDLTKDGELVSHKLFRERFLEPLRAQGIPAYVVPGNHDINNPHGVVFKGDTTERTEIIKDAAQFAEFYADYGYKNAIARDENSLSYVAKLTDKLYLLVLDVMRYEDNDFPTNKCYWQARMKPATLDFAVAQLQKAKAQGITVIGMMHAGIVEHWKYQNEMIPGYVVDDWEKIAKTLRKNGLTAVFTGHAHVQDIVEYKGLYDIETGSTVTYPCPYHICTLDGNALSIDTKLLNNSPEYLEHAAHGFYEGIHFIVSDMFRPVFSEPLLGEVADEVAKDMTRQNLGNEKLTADDVERINALAKKVRKQSFKYSIVLKKCAKAILTDDGVNDTKTTIILNK